MTARTLLVVSARAGKEAREAVSSGNWPRKDFLELASKLAADVIDCDTIDHSRALHLLSLAIGMPATEAVAAFLRRGSYDRMFSDGEHIGLPLAVLLSLTRRPPRHVTIGHLLDTPLKRRICRWLRPQRGIATVLVHASTQQARGRDLLGLLPSQINLIPYQIDPEFWCPRPRNPGELLICSAGLEYRDYETFVAAAREMPVRVVIAAASHWSRHRNQTEATQLPANLQVVALDYSGLRDLYARSRFVVVPLREVGNQAGITTILEAMAMGKAVIVTATNGQRDVVRGRLCTSEGVTDELLGGPAGFGITGPLAQDETGLYVPTGDVLALRQAIQYLLDRPQDAARMGAAGRRLVEETMGIDQFVQAVSDRLTRQSAGSQDLPSGDSDSSVELPAAESRVAARP